MHVCGENMVISKDTIRANIFTDVITVLKAQVSDPLSRGEQWIFSNTNSITNPSFIGFPVLTLNKVNVEKGHPTFDNAYSDKSTPIIITVYSTDDIMVDTLSDAIDKIMVPSNFPQFKFNDYTEADDDADFGTKKTPRKCKFRRMSYFVELDGVA